MDREEALQLLRGGQEGVVEWNNRRGRGEKIPDLSGTDLGLTDLRGVDLSDMDLRGVNLRRTLLVLRNCWGLMKTTFIRSNARRASGNSQSSPCQMRAK
jgi:Pentapeptide repeats (8 copies)